MSRLTRMAGVRYQFHDKHDELLCKWPDSAGESALLAHESTDGMPSMAPPPSNKRFS